MNRMCQHGLALVKGILCDHGYCQARIYRDGKLWYCENFGQHTSHAQRVAEVRLAEKRKEILEGKIGIVPELPSKQFSEAAGIWFDLWKDERHPDGKIKHNEESCYKVQWTIQHVLKPAFGTTLFHNVMPVDVQRWRDAFVKQGRSGVTANRYQSIMASIYSHTARWIATEKIKPAFKLPEKNPCADVEKSSSVKRERILTRYEAKKLKNAFMQCNDVDGWEICKLALRSVLSLKDLKKIDIGDTIDIERSKTGVPINIPITNLVKLNWYGWRTRWEKARDMAGLHDLQFRDLRKSGANVLNGQYDTKLISQYMGHSSIKTTEKSYIVDDAEKLKPLADCLTEWVDSI